MNPQNNNQPPAGPAPAPGANAPFVAPNAGAAYGHYGPQPAVSSAPYAAPPADPNGQAAMPGYQPPLAPGAPPPPPGVPGAPGAQAGKPVVKGNPNSTQNALLMAEIR